MDGRGDGDIQLFPPSPIVSPSKTAHSQQPRLSAFSEPGRFGFVCTQCRRRKARSDHVESDEWGVPHDAVVLGEAAVFVRHAQVKADGPHKAPRLPALVRQSIWELHVRARQSAVLKAETNKGL
jgi:hypothetical protein